MTTCPKCSNKWALSRYGSIFFPWASKEESDRLNYRGSRCQICGYEWNKFRVSTKPREGE